jgi:hypothetical protein
MATNITSIQHGIVFLMAKWGGQAKWATNQLKSFLEQHQVALDHLTCIDIDPEQYICNLPEFSGKIHG